MKLNCKKLSELISVIDNKNKNKKFSELLGININKEFIKSVANTVGTDLAKYKIIENECFACNLMHVGRDKKIPMALYKGEGAIVSPAYYVFNIKNRDEILPEYLELYFGKEEFDKKMYFLSQNGIRGNLDWKDFSNEVIKYPSIEMQQKIIKINNLINKSIITNNQINDNLYKYMENLYKEWFVKYSIFKDSSFKNSELGMIPDECEVTDIYSISNIIYGAPFKSNLFNNEKKGKPIIRIRDLKNQEFKTYTEEIHPKGYLLKYGDIAVGMDGEFKPYIWGNDEAWLNQRICVFDNKRKKGKAFLYYSLKPLLEYVESTETATTVIHIGKNDFDKFRIVLPNANILNRFDELTNPMIKQIVNNIKENNSLTNLRNTLLPKLMNGEIDLDKIEI